MNTKIYRIKNYQIKMRIWKKIFLIAKQYKIKLNYKYTKKQMAHICIFRHIMLKKLCMSSILYQSNYSC